jgi:hypothetical protein
MFSLEGSCARPEQGMRPAVEATARKVKTTGYAKRQAQNESSSFEKQVRRFNSEMKM